MSGPHWKNTKYLTWDGMDKLTINTSFGQFKIKVMDRYNIVHSLHTGFGGYSIHHESYRVTLPSAVGRQLSQYLTFSQEEFDYDTYKIKWPYQSKS